MTLQKIYSYSWADKVKAASWSSAGWEDQPIRRVALVQGYILALCFEMAAAIGGPVEPFPRASEGKQNLMGISFWKIHQANADTFSYLIRKPKKRSELQGTAILGQ